MSILPEDVPIEQQDFETRVMRVFGGLEGGMKNVAQILGAYLTAQLSMPGLGRVYRRGKKGKHRASAPGQSPAPDTNELRRSVFVEQIGPYAWRVGVVHPAAHALNFGTTTAGRNHDTVILPRPFMEPALAAASKAMNIALVNSFGTASGI